MTDRNESTSSSAFFEAKYQKKADPWRFSSNSNELRRYRAIFAAISHRRYRHAYEPGCSIGVLTERLARICDLVDAFDFSATAATQARIRCAALPNVRVRCAELPEAVPPTDYDLLVLSEIGYYFTPEMWASVSGSLIAAMPPGATVLASHWLGYSKDHCITGKQVHEVLHGNPQLRIEQAESLSLLKLERLVRI